MIYEYNVELVNQTNITITSITSNTYLFLLQEHLKFTFSDFEMYGTLLFAIFTVTCNTSQRKKQPLILLSNWCFLYSDHYLPIPSIPW